MLEDKIAAESKQGEISEARALNGSGNGSSEISKVAAPIHDFTKKLLQPGIFQALKEYVLWQHAIRKSQNPEKLYSEGPKSGPFSVNLDLTTACNYACDHCVDMPILNTGIRFNYDQLKSSLSNLKERGLRSVIIIGGGEPTVDPKFEEMVKYVKENGLQLGIVTNGSMMEKVERVADYFGERDWVRLSLDSGNDSTFQAMHKPKRKVTLDQICDNVLDLKTKHPKTKVGFSYIVTWPGAYTNNTKIVPNIDELYLAAELAKEHKFDYLSVKPFLDREEESGAEVIGITKSGSSYEETIRRIREEVARARKSFENGSFKIIESTNLRSLSYEDTNDYTRQPKNCHMTFFRQVMSPLGTFICPVYRGDSFGSVGGKAAYATQESIEETRLKTAEAIQTFDAAERCKKVTCLYNPANWFIESLIEDPSKLDQLKQSEEGDYFL